jgi:hypothetical protein
MNLSEGGMLLGPMSSFPSFERVPMMLSVPQYPSLKNYTLQKLKEFSIDLFPRKVIRVKAMPVRQVPVQGQEGLYSYGLFFSEIDNQRQKVIDNYVETFLSNIVHLISLVDMVNYDEESLEMVRELSLILGYPFDIKLSTLRQSIMRDYRSLQWL